MILCPQVGKAFNRNIKEGRKMMEIEIPGWGNMEVEQIVLDMNGTLASDGRVSAEVKKKINSLSEKVKIYVLTADTQGTADEEVRGMNAEIVKVPEEDSANEKLNFLKTMTPETTVAIGNGSNDQLILKEAGLAIAVLGDEGISLFAMKHADILVKDVSDALNLFLKPRRLIATLRE
jgi:soluble P-type ATPase